MGNKYIRERLLEEIVTKMMTPQVDEAEESDKEHEETNLNPNSS